MREGILTAIEHGPQALAPLVDQLLENGELVTAELLDWMSKRVRRIDSDGVLLMWCEFGRKACNLADYFTMMIGLNPTYSCAYDLRRLHMRSKPIRVAGPYTVFAPVSRWFGQICAYCSADNDYCHYCQSTGYSARPLGPKAVLFAPIFELKFHEADVFNLPRELRTSKNLEVDAIDWARRRAGIEHNLNGEKYVR